MDKYEAEKIVNKYGEAIVKGTTGFVRRKRFLPCSKAKIKQAFFVYLEAIISETNNLPKEMGNNLVSTYGLLNSFIDDEEADELIEIGKMVQEHRYRFPEDQEKIDKYFKYGEKSIHDGELFDEINEYIGECYKKYNIK